MSRKIFSSAALAVDVLAGDSRVPAGWLDLRVHRVGSTTLARGVQPEEAIQLARAILAHYDQPERPADGEAPPWWPPAPPPAAPPNGRRELTDDSRAVIVDVLCGQALADHLGDVREEERKLWRLLGVDRPVLDHDSAWRNTEATLRAAGIPLPAELDEATG